LVSAVGMGVAMPVKQALLNSHIPSAQRATIISFDSLFGDLGGGLGQTGWGYVARVRSIADAWVPAGAFLFLGVPFLAVARRFCREKDAFAVAGAAEPQLLPLALTEPVASAAPGRSVPCEQRRESK
jgi:MFS family permease